MIDTKALVNDYERVCEQLSIKKVSKETLNELKNLAISYKTCKQELEDLQAFQNDGSRKIGQWYRSGGCQDLIDDLKPQLDVNKIAINKAESALNTIETKLQDFLYNIPNLPDSATPAGEDENDNIEIKKVLTPKVFDFTPKEHWELGVANGWIDFESGVKLAKSRFSVLRGMGARLNRALINFMLECNQKAGFESVVTPVIVNARALFGTGQLPKFENDMFKVDSHFDDEESENDLYLISTSEITLTNLYQDSIIPSEKLPIMLTSHTPCFRKEAGSAGRDTRGMIRQHQFDKVELVAITHPNESAAMQAKMVQTASDILSALNLPHRLVQLCGGDLGFSASNTIDIEVWLPGQNCYREISSISNTRDFQARRAKIRYKEKGKNALVHTLNGSSLAVGRTLIAIMENYQQANGDIAIPDVLQKYL
ncbi:serine--tRNA ligase [Helicobacter typhlonius]|uniref:serine--tRNA ligase n=1 Tax=Helicobacter typhlonius TaxID=76936 RepID=UPI002FE34503